MGKYGFCSEYITGDPGTHRCKCSTSQWMDEHLEENTSNEVWKHLVDGKLALNKHRQ